LTTLFKIHYNMQSLRVKNKSRYYLLYASAISFTLFIFVMGFIRISDSDTRDEALVAVPWVILLSSILVFLFSDSFLRWKDVLTLFLIALLAFLIEVIGVHTGVIFGNYTYGESLGMKLLNTPLIIGLNWVFLVYSTAAVFEYVDFHPFIKIGLASLTMLLYDLILEFLAPALNMWYWHTDSVPVRNYVAWFLMAAMFHYLLRLFGVNTKNQMAPVILLIQFVFFLMLLLFI
jgi:bisanhydrobacterioruberin hydratase